MKEDILEQIVDEYLQAKGYFTLHNVKFKPSSNHNDYVLNQDSNHSDIDVLGFNPLLTSNKRVMAVSCKSWQGGFKPISIINALENDKRVGGKEAWKHFRELTKDKWAEAMINCVKKATNENEFTYVTAVTLLKGDKATWENYAPFQTVIKQPVEVWTFEDIVRFLTNKLSTTMASSEIGRMLQLLIASNQIQKGEKGNR